VHRTTRFAASIALLGLVALSGCGGGRRQFTPLSRVQFEFAGVSNVRLVGIPINANTRYRTLGMLDAARLAAAIVSGQAPLEMTAHLEATNPTENPVAARIVDVQWSLYIEDRHALDGGLEAPVAIAPGATADVPLSVRLDLAQMGAGGARDVLDLAVAIAGQGTIRKDVRLEIRPTIQTPVGPIRYPYPIAVRRAGTETRVSR
jgi:hypothetical protein